MDDFGQTTGTAGVVSSGGTANGAIETLGDQDWFGVSMTAGRTYVIDLEGSATGGEHCLIPISEAFTIPPERLFQACSTMTEVPDGMPGSSLRRRRPEPILSMRARMAGPGRIRFR